LASASAHEQVKDHWAAREIGPNDVIDWSSIIDGVEFLSAHGTSNATGVRVSTTKQVDEGFAYAFTILLKCSDDVPVEVWSTDNIFENDETVDLACNAGATLTSAALAITTITSHGEGEPGDGEESGDPGNSGEDEAEGD
jgi:dTDP-glucose pyrophosphorylase